MKMVLCETEADLEAFVLFFFRNRSSFSEEFTVRHAVESLYIMLSETKTLLFFHRSGELLGALNYSYGTREQQFQDTNVLFVDSALIEEKFRNTRSFVRGYQQFLAHVTVENPDVDMMKFHAYQHDSYIHRLYGKLAAVVETHEDEMGHKDVFAAPFMKVKSFVDSFR